MIVNRFATILSGLALTLMVACGPVRGTPSQETQIIAVGDSILAWNRFSGRDIPQVVADQTGMTVYNAAANGARFLGEGGIPSQLPNGNWAWLIVDGGGNDIGAVCGDRAAERHVLDRLISEDLSGAYSTFMRQVTSQRTRVIIMGYAPISILGGPFAACAQTLGELRSRQARLANSLDNVVFVDVREVVRPDNLAAYSTDRVHPTPVGGALMAGMIVAQMR